MRQLIAGNWKMNGLIGEARALAVAVAAGGPSLGNGCDLLVCPPATALTAVVAAVAGSAVAVGGQDCHGATHGAHTGDISAPMLRDAGASWVILGHSERRTNHGESDAIVHAKVLAAVAAGLTPIVCVGETEAQRGAGHQTAVVGRQLAGSLPAEFAGVIAYEPLWAIGTGESATEADVEAMHRFIRAELARRWPQTGATLRLLYGGSVKPNNAAALLGLADVDGALVGGASLVAADFLAIAQAARR